MTLKVFALLCEALLLIAASSPTASRLSSASAEAPAELKLPRSDGSVITAYLDRRGEAGKQGLFVIAQGSGCGSVTDNANVEEAKAILPDFAVVTVEDYGVERGDLDKMATSGCRPAYYAHHTISQRARDYEQVVRHLESEWWWNGKLVLFGGSEGGAVVQELAPRVPAKAAIVFSSATGVPFRDAFVQVLPPPVVAQVGPALADVRAHPESTRLFLGNSYRWWADIMDRRLSDDLLAAKEPVLVVQGERDRSNPVSSARAVRDAFHASRKCNLTYVEYDGYDHHMIDASGNDHLAEVLGDVRLWVKAQLSNPEKNRCAAT